VTSYHDRVGSNPERCLASQLVADTPDSLSNTARLCGLEQVAFAPLTGSGGGFSFESKESTGTLELPGAPAAASPVRPGNLLGNSDPYIDTGMALQVGANFNIDGSGSATSSNATSE